MRCSVSGQCRDPAAVGCADQHRELLFNPLTLALRGSPSTLLPEEEAPRGSFLQQLPAVEMRAFFWKGLQASSLPHFTVDAELHSAAVPGVSREVKISILTTYVDLMLSNSEHLS